MGGKPLSIRESSVVLTSIRTVCGSETLKGLSNAYSGYSADVIDHCLLYSSVYDRIISVKDELMTAINLTNAFLIEL